MYAYLVENKWTPNGSRQNNKKYVGKVFFLQKVRDIEFFEHFPDYISKQKTLKELLKDTIIANLISYGLIQEGSYLKNSEIVVDLDTLKITQRHGKPAALALNEGFLSNDTLSRILNYEKSENEEDKGKEGYLLAKYCIEAGIIVPQKIFIAMYEACPKCTIQNSLDGA